jgi:hypothetical protein
MDFQKITFPLEALSRIGFVFSRLHFRAGQSGFGTVEYAGSIVIPRIA